MKKIIYPAVIVLILALSSCNNDTDLVDDYILFQDLNEDSGE